MTQFWSKINITSHKTDALSSDKEIHAGRAKEQQMQNRAPIIVVIVAKIRKS
jgi:hypothetical protein